MDRHPTRPSLRPALSWRPDPTPGESWFNWLWRAAASLHVPSGHLLELIGAASGERRLSPARAAFLLPAGRVEGVAAAAGLGAGQVEGMLLNRWTRPLLGADDPDGVTLHAVAMSGRFLTAHSRACPACLDDRPDMWPLRWRLAAGFACDDHGLLLVERCPACGAPPQSFPDPDDPGRAAYGGTRSPLRPTEVPTPAACRCGNRWDGLPDSMRLPAPAGQPFAERLAVADGRDVSDALHRLALLFVRTARPDEMDALPPDAADRARTQLAAAARPGATAGWQLSLYDRVELAAAAFAWAAAAWDPTAGRPDPEPVRRRAALANRQSRYWFSRNPLLAAALGRPAAIN